MPFNHLDIPEEIANLHNDIRRRHESRYQRLMAQHQKMKKEEGIRLIRDAIVILSILAGVLTILGLIFHKEEK